MAAVLAAGPHAVLSHRSAAALWLRRSDRIEVTVPSDRLRPGIQVYRERLPADERTIERRIPVTTTSRTLFDLAAVVPQAQVERALKEAEVQQLADTLSLPDLLTRHPRSRGSRTIKSILDRRAPLTRSELEVRFLSFVERSGLRRPEVNVPLLVDGRWIECDCLWREARLIAELDGFAAHGTFAAFQADRGRDRALQARGWRLVRITWAQLRDEPEAIARDLRALLSMFPGHAARHV